MAVNAVQRNEYRSNQASYTKAAGIGALSGLALKYVLPLTQQEKDKSYSDRLDFKRSVKDREIRALRNANPPIPGGDQFLKLYDAHELTAGKVKALGEPGTSQTTGILKGINTAARKFANDAFTAIRKYFRPAGTFIAVGAAVALSTAFVYNVLGKMSEK